MLLTMVAVFASFAYSSVASAQEWSLMPEYSDEFNAPVLDPKWSFDNPGPDPGGQSWSLTSSPGFLSMTTTGPTDLWGGTNTAPKMLEDSPEGNFRIIARVLAAPDVANEHAGILIMQSPTNWVRLIRDSRENSVFLQSTSASDHYIPFSGSDVVLRLTKVGSGFEGAFSIDGGLNYTLIGDIQGPGNPVYVGTVVASTPEGNVFTAEFDYFRVDSVGGIIVPGLTSFSLAIFVLLLIGTFAIFRRKLCRSKP